MWTLHRKMKRPSNTLSNWSKEEFGDTFKKVRGFEEKHKDAEENLIQNNSVTDRESLHAINAQYTRYLKLEDAIT